MLPVDEKDVKSRPIKVEDAGFTSSEACQSCHPDQYATWHASYHRTMTQVASSDSVVGDFGDSGITLSAFGRTSDSGGKATSSGSSGTTRSGGR